jgi:hypothetical protein
VETVDNVHKALFYLAFSLSKTLLKVLKSFPHFPQGGKSKKFSTESFKLFHRFIVENPVDFRFYRCYAGITAL